MSKDRRGGNTPRTLALAALACAISLLFGCAKPAPGDSPVATIDSSPDTTSRASARAEITGYHFRDIGLGGSAAAADTSLLTIGLRRDRVHERALRETEPRTLDRSYAGRFEGDSVRVFLTISRTGLLRGISVLYIGVQKASILYTLRQKYGEPSGMIGATDIEDAAAAISGLTQHGFVWCSSGSPADQIGTCPPFDNRLQFTYDEFEGVKSTSVLIEAGRPRPKVDSNY